MTRADIIIDLKNLIGSGVEVNDAGLNTWVDDAYMMVVDEIKKANPDYYVQSVSINTVADQQEYALASDFEAMILVNQQIAGEWKRVMPMGNADIRMIPRHSDTTSNQGFSTAEPRYYIYKTTLGLMPIPTASVSEGLKYWYSYTPASLSTDGSEPDFPSKWHHILKFHAYANYLDQDDEHTSAERMRQRFDLMVSRMIESISAKQEDEPRSVTITQNTDLYVDQTKYI